MGCSIEKCVRPHYAKSYCNMHYQRDRRGLPMDSEPLSRAGENNPDWRGDDVSYSGAHRRVYRARGPARFCDRDATHGGSFQWALDHEGAPVIFPARDNGLLISPDPDDYVSLCVSCHKLEDLARLS